jgi:hypothetical protein
VREAAAKTVRFREPAAPESLEPQAVLSVRARARGTAEAHREGRLNTT